MSYPPHRTYTTGTVLLNVVSKSLESKEPHYKLLIGPLYRSFCHLASSLLTFSATSLTLVTYCRLLQHGLEVATRLKCQVWRQISLWPSCFLTCIHDIAVFSIQRSRKVNLCIRGRPDLTGASVRLFRPSPRSQKYLLHHTIHYALILPSTFQ
jgi:hypothetical protein